MASTSGYSLDLGLPQFPDPTAVPPQLYDVITAIHQSLAALAKSYDALLGLQERSYADYVGLKNVDYREFNTVDRLSTLFIIAGENIEYGQILRVGGDSKAYLSVFYYSTFFGSGYGYSPQIGFAGKPALAGEAVPVVTKGFIGSTALEGRNIMAYHTPPGSIAYPPDGTISLDSFRAIVGPVFKRNIEFTGAV